MIIDYGTLIKTRRKEKGLTQQELADRAYCHRTTVCAIETGAKAASFDILLSILDALGLKVDIVEA